MWNWGAATLASFARTQTRAPLRLNSDKIETFARRLVRKAILTQFVETSHNVFKTEERLVSESAESIKNWILELEAKNPYSRIEIQNSIWINVKEMARQILPLHEVEDEETNEEILFWLDYESFDLIAGRQSNSLAS